MVEWSLDEVPTLEVFKTRMDVALDSLVQWKASLPTAGVGTRSSSRSLPTLTILGFYNEGA